MLVESTIRYAKSGSFYPFTESVTGHRVELNKHTLHALCAIDALGVADMYETDIFLRHAHIAARRSA